MRRRSAIVVRSSSRRDRDFDRGFLSRGILRRRVVLDMAQDGVFFKTGWYTLAT